MTEFEAARAFRGVSESSGPEASLLNLHTSSKAAVTLHVSDGWDLSHIGITDVDQHMRTLEASAEAFLVRLRRLQPSLTVREIDSVLDDLADVSEGRERLIRFVRNRFQINAADPQLRAEKEAADSFIGELDKKLLEVKYFLKQLPVDIAEQAVGTSRYRSFIENELRLAPHLLEEAAERAAIEDFATRVKQLSNDYTEVDAAFRANIAGKEVTRGGIREFIRSSDPEHRRAAYAALLNMPRREEERLFNIYRDIVLFWQENEVKNRDFPSVMDATAAQWGLTAVELRAALQQAREASPLFAAVRRAKADALGLSPFTRFDLFAPLGAPLSHVSFESGVHFVHETLGRISPVLAEAFASIVNAGHIDAALRPSKRSLAYCSYPGVSILPYLFLNWQGSYDDQVTLAHEAGHGVHGVLAARYGDQLTYEAAMPVMESVSMLVQFSAAERLLRAAPEPERMACGIRLFESLESALLKQCVIVDFEEKAFRLLPAGAGMDEMSEAYLESLRAVYGPELEFDPMFGREYLRTPHLFLNPPCYCASYVLATMTAMSWLGDLNTGGRAAVPELLGRLSAGGKEPTASLLSSLSSDAWDIRKLEYDTAWLRKIEDLSRVAGLAT